jgi:dihydroorotase
MYAPAPGSILDDQGRLFPDVAAARRRGVIFDFGNGVADHFDWPTVERARKAGFLARYFLNGLERHVEDHWRGRLRTSYRSSSCSGCRSAKSSCATVNAARVFPSFDNRGTLSVGAPTNVAIIGAGRRSTRRQLQKTRFAASASSD